jgi:hypothetical protein
MKQTFNIPAGCTVGSIEQDGDKVIIEFKSEYTPKRGDVCVMTTYTGQEVIILVDYVLGNNISTFAEFWTMDTIFNINDEITTFAHDTFRPAAKGEKQLLLSKLKEKGKRFNPDKMCIEDDVWMPAGYEDYWYIAHDGFVNNDTNWFDNIDKYRLSTGNCFKTKEAAEKVDKEALKAHLKAFFDQYPKQ